MQDYYAILQVSPDAEPEVIEGAYRRLAQKYHPDTNSSADADTRMRSINEAYQVLGDLNKRITYDQMRKAQAYGTAAGPIFASPTAQDPVPSPPPPVTPTPAETTTRSPRRGTSFTTITLALIPVAIVINMVIGQIVQNVLKLPIYLDSIGTVLVGALAGPLAGAITGALSNLIWAVVFSSPISAPFAITAFFIGICAGVASTYGAFKNIALTIVAGLITGAIAAIISAPISAFAFGGVTGSGTDLIVAAAQATGANLLAAATIQGFISDPLDKTISYLVVWLIVRGMSKRLLGQFPRSENVMGE